MKTDRRLSFLSGRTLVLISLALLTLTACGGGSENPAGPSEPARGVVLTGSVLGATGASGALALRAGSPSAVGAVTVAVQGSPGISTTVLADGSFTLRGLPTGSFSLIFTRDGVLLGTLTFSSVMPNQELTITVSLTGGSIFLMEEQRNGIGHGDVEIEARVDQLIALNTSGESRFLIDRRTVVVRPGETSIRDGNSARGVAEIMVGRLVHVKGVWLPIEGSTQPVLAYEIKLQGDPAPAPTSSPTPKPSESCMIDGAAPGRGIELEGAVVSGSAANFRLSVNGNRSSSAVDILAGGASFECTPKSGPNAPTPEQCRASVTTGARVHVRGSLDTCSPTSARVTASMVTLQK